MDRIWHSDKWTIELFTYMVVYFVLDYVWKTIRKRPKTEETEKVCIMPENLSEEDKCEIMKLKAEGQKVKAIKKSKGSIWRRSVGGKTVCRQLMRMFFLKAAIK